MKHSAIINALDPKVQTAEPVHIQIEKYLRHQIEKGILSCGQRLPSTRELSARWNVHDRAIQKAMKRLTAEGILERSPRRGTFIRAKGERPNIGILVGPSLLNEESRFYRAIVEFLREEIFSRGMDVRIYDCLAFKKTEQTSAIINEFMRDTRSRLFKGLISISAPLDVFRKSILTTPLPIAYFPGVRAAAAIDNSSFMRCAIGCIIERRCRRIAYIRTGKPTPHMRDIDEFLQFGISTGLQVGKDHIHQIIPPINGVMNYESTGYTETVKLMRRWDTRKSWPDALIVSDDVLMKGVALALYERKIRVPEQLLVIIEANEGVNYPYLVPVVRIEVSPREISQALTKILWEMILGSKPPSSPVVIDYKMNAETLKNIQGVGAGLYNGNYIASPSGVMENKPEIRAMSGMQ
ncbi:MAG: GntR family transcriptional regulator [Victivallales bacterium]